MPELAGLHSNFTILDTDDQKRVVKQICETMGVDDKKYPPQAIIDRIQRWKDKGMTVEKLQGEYKSNVLTEVYQRYQQRLLELNCVDFGDILLYALNILLSNPDILANYQNRFKYIMVDEYQDTNVTQYLFLRLLSQTHKTCAVSAMTINLSILGAAPKLKIFCVLKKTFPNAKPSAWNAITVRQPTFWRQPHASSAIIRVVWAKP